VRIPRKNIRDFRGKPMLQWAVDAASALFDRIIVSTDDAEIAALAGRLNCEVHMRDQDDGSRGTQEVVADVLRALNIEHGVVCTLYPCSPLLEPWVLQDAMDVYEAGGAEHLVSVQAGTNNDAGCFYLQEVGALLAGDRLWSDVTIAYPLSRNRCIDINTPEDWSRAEQMFDALHST